MASLEDVWLFGGGVASLKRLWPHRRRCGLTRGGVASWEEVRLSGGGTSLGVGLRV